MHLDQLSATELQSALESLQGQYASLKESKLSLDLTRGKPSTEQVTLSDALDGILEGNYLAEDGSDTRNYGGLDGLPEAKRLFAPMLGVPENQIVIGGNASLTLMYTVMDLALSVGLQGSESAWGNNDQVKFLCPVPGYDRHFSICEHLGIEMIQVPMLDSGPDMDVVESLIEDDPAIKGIWCVPRFSNPTGCVYSDETVTRIANLGNIASEHFLVMWDNAYTVHTLYADAPELTSMYEASLAAGTADNIFQFGSSSKITHAGSGVSFLSSSEANIAAFKRHLIIQSIGPDKVNQLRHVKLLQDSRVLEAHMARHADIIRPRFEAVLEILDRELGDTDMGEWLSPKGGYFISFNTRPGLAQEVVKMAKDIGVNLTPAGATYPYGDDPLDSNIRLAPTFPALADVISCTEAFVVCVKLASVRQRLEQL